MEGWTYKTEGISAAETATGKIRLRRLVDAFATTATAGTIVSGYPMSTSAMSISGMKTRRGLIRGGSRTGGDYSMGRD